MLHNPQIDAVMTMADPGAALRERILNLLHAGQKDVIEAIRLLNNPDWHKAPMIKDLLTAAKRKITEDDACRPVAGDRPALQNPWVARGCSVLSCSAPGDVASGFPATSQGQVLPVVSTVNNQFTADMPGTWLGRAPMSPEQSNRFTDYVNGEYVSYGIIFQATNPLISFQQGRVITLSVETRINSAFNIIRGFPVPAGTLMPGGAYKIDVRFDEPSAALALFPLSVVNGTCYVRPIYGTRTYNPGTGRLAGSGQKMTVVASGALSSYVSVNVTSVVDPTAAMLLGMAACDPVAAAMSYVAQGLPSGAGDYPQFPSA